MFYALENFIRKARRSFSLTEWAIRHLGIPVSGDAKPEAPGLLLIQIDGLSHRQFERALRHKQLPFLHSLMRHQHYHLKTFYSGIPATTPAVQAEIFYGVRCAVPAFTFVNRSTKEFSSMYNPETVKPIEARLRSQNEGLLTGGSSWSNIYTGGATQTESHICAASLGWSDLLESSSLPGLFKFLLLQIPSALRIITLLIAEFFIGIWDVIDGVSHRPKSSLKEIRFILNRLFVCIGLREYITLGGKIDLARGLPTVHVNFLGYDEQAHRRGPSSAFAHWSLRGIDAAIRKLYFAARASHRRDYQIWIFSDHGQETTRAYSEIYPGGIEQALRDALNQFDNSGTFATLAPSASGGATRHHPRANRRPLLERSLWKQRTREEANSFSVTAMGPVGHVYFSRQFGLDDKETLARWLVQQAGVPGVLIAVTPGRAKWIRANGSLSLPGEGSSILPHPEPMRKEVAEDLLGLCEQENSGDLILLGWNPNAPHFTFEEERGAHGGPGLEETTGFALLPPRTILPEGNTDYLRGSTLRAAALHYLRRKRITPPLVKSPSRNLRVLTYNVHGCLGMDGKISTQRIARLIDQFEPGLVALQELDANRPRSGGEEQAHAIAHELGMHLSFYPVFVQGTEHYGDAVLSRWPIETIRMDQLASDSVDREPRGAIWLRVHFDGIPIHFFNTHFGLGRFQRVAHMTDLLGQKWIGGVELNEPIILCGDFNMLPKTLPYRAVVSRLHDVQNEIKNFRPQTTFATASPIFRIDHIFVSGHFKVRRVQVPRNHLTRLASDHLPLIADLHFKDEHCSAIGSPEEN